jgi:hypothetical protein
MDKGTAGLAAIVGMKKRPTEKPNNVQPVNGQVIFFQLLLPW